MPTVGIDHLAVPTANAERLPDHNLLEWMIYIDK